MTINEWSKRYLKSAKVTIQHESDVIGECKKVVGARALYAQVGLKISKSDELEFLSSLPISDEKMCSESGWLDCIYQGVLDVMLVKPLNPINVFKCEVNAIEFHEIDSSPEAFRLAGRDAASKFLKDEKFVVI